MRAFASSFVRELDFLSRNFWDRAMVSWFPAMLLGILAWVFGAGVVRDLPIVLVDQDQTQISRELGLRLDAAPAIHVVASILDFGEAKQFVQARKAYVVVLIPSGASREILQGNSAAIEVFYNASYSTASGALLRDVNSVIEDYSAKLAMRQTAALQPSGVRPPPIKVQSTLHFNPQRSYEFQLVSLLHPALLHLAFMIAVTSALGRELRDRTIGEWLCERWSTVPAIAGKIAPYILIFMGWSLVVTVYLAKFRGWPIQGRVSLLILAYLCMYTAYSAIALALVGVTRSMMQSLSVAGIYAGASFAFTGAIFPIQSASGFARVWSQILPFTWFTKVLNGQWSMAGPPEVAIGYIGILCLFTGLGTLIGLPGYINAATQPAVWGRR
ncbi:ABC transporter permease [Ponticaulis sp.]|uniref:ABC transporter permease n=1 Tax=Ponticaulis sp. TaxID=2020902 RepID=UPI000B6C2385|nr:ABC transporter permease [Ponticaulis sp.]MAI92017.1 hypothetical protein [Ponticaulis sp.]OUX96343.1 MAG: hypothetical protein CBB65_16425 [Hyphomonadaceae bacterium TMED5]|tara:strand:+ start:10779 stop:11933 length:1155 start_codon:yes stop_codon:yes gene_type:complete